MSKRRKRHSPEQIVRKLRDAEAMLSQSSDTMTQILLDNKEKYGF
jgi:hypothetical protein